MNTNGTGPYILVGIDGSPSATLAVVWAATEAARRQVPLHLVYAVDFGGFGTGFNLGAQRSFFDHLEAEGAKHLQHAKERIAATDPNMTVHTSLLNGRPLPILVELSKHALLTIVGSSGSGPIEGLLAGSVAVSLTAHGHSPVVVVRGDETRDTGPIVVGVDASPNSDDAIEWAFDEATIRHTDIVAVYTWYEYPVDSEYARSCAPGWEVLEAEQAEVLSNRLAQWREKYPNIHVHELATTGKPAWAIMNQAEHAQLIVVGSRGRGDVTGLLGSTSHTLIHKAPCTVLIARSQRC